MGKNYPVGKFNLWIECNMKYVLEKNWFIYIRFFLWKRCLNFNLAYQTSQEAGREHHVKTFCQVAYRSVQRLQKKK